MKRACLGLLLLLPCPALAQIVRGKITDSSTGAVITGANVRVLNRTGRQFYAVIADADGTFELIAPAADSFVVQVERIGYRTATSIKLVLPHGMLLDVEVRLSAQPIALQPVTVVAKNIDVRLMPYFERAERNQRAGVGRIFTRADIERMHAQLFSHVLRRMPTRPGAGGCNGDQIYIDNVPLKIRPTDAFDPTDLDLMVSTEDVEGVERYRAGEIPFPYDMSLCTVTLIWRKPYGRYNQPLSWKRIFGGAGLVLFFVVANYLTAKNL